MKRLLLTVLTICFLGLGISNAQDREIHGITDKLAESLAQSGKKTVAVVDFTDLQGNVTELGRFLAEEISASLAESAKGIEVVDRTNLKVIIQENKLAATGIIDPATARKLGQVAGVDSLITGTLTPFGDAVHLSVKILDTATARIVGATRGDIPKTKAIEELLGQGVATANSGPRPQVPPPVVQAAPKAVQPSVEVQGIRVVADNCRANGQTVVCMLTLTSQQQDVKVRFGAGARSSGRWVHSEAYDDSGVEYGSDAITFAGKTSYPFAEFESLLVSDTPTQMILKFNQFSNSSANVTLLKFLLEVWPSSGGYRQSDFALRNIPIQR